MSRKKTITEKDLERAFNKGYKRGCDQTHAKSYDQGYKKGFECAADLASTWDGVVMGTKFTLHDIVLAKANRLAINKMRRKTQNSKDSVSAEVTVGYHCSSMGASPFVTVNKLDGSEVDKPHSYMYGLPLDIFGHKFLEGSRFRVWVHPLPSPGAKKVKNPWQPKRR